MKVLILCLLATVAYAKVQMTVSVTESAIDISGTNSVELPCEYVMQSDVSNVQHPFIYWIKGISVDHEDAVVIFKGFKYWNESLGEYREFFNGYAERAVVEDLENPSLVLSGVSSSDEGRYWCMVAEWSGRQQEGTDADSVALLSDKDAAFVEPSTVAFREVTEGENLALACGAKGTYDVVTWYKGPFHKADSENFTHTEIGSYNTIGYYDLTNDEVYMEEDYKTMSIDSKLTLSIPNVAIPNAGRFWCEVSYTMATNQELETDRSSTSVTVIPAVAFSCDNYAPGLYPDPTDCSMYYECVSGDPITYHRSCGYDGLVFDERYGYCDWAANVPPPCGTNTDI